MELQDVKADPKNVYWCTEYQSYCVVMGFCEWDGACIIIELHDDEDITGELRTTESPELWPDPITALKHREGLKHFHQARTLTIEGWVGDDRINDIRQEHTWAKDEGQAVFDEFATEYGNTLAQLIENTVNYAIRAGDKYGISGEIEDMTFSLDISCAYEEPGFSHLGCEACSPHVGNNVTDCVGIHKTGDKFNYQICDSCLYRHEYGWD